ncbi:hypothetical protein EXW41_28880 (plasmid) [Bacillus wiedmannii]|nr:hypothetical protein EXW41_28880 [Bacillus wiedmannii]
MKTKLLEQHQILLLLLSWHFICFIAFGIACNTFFTSNNEFYVNKLSIWTAYFLRSVVFFRNAGDPPYNH